jgi:hypothetical protein
MRLTIALVGLIAFTGLVWAEDVDDSYAALQEAVKNKDVAAIKKLAPETAKQAAALAAKPKPADESLAENWKGRVEFGKQVGAYAEFALSSSAIAASDPKVTVELCDMLYDVNPKSTYLTGATPYYMAAIGKDGGSAKQLTAADKLVKGNPNNEDALYYLATGRMSGPYAARLTAVMKSKAKPEGVADADWERKKAQYLGQGYYIAGAAAATAQSWKDADTNLRSAVTYIPQNPSTAGAVYFYLGLANYNLGKLTNDRTKIQEAVKFSQQSAGLAGPMQQQANNNVRAMQQALATGRY